MARVLRNKSVREDLLQIGRNIAEDSQSLAVALAFLDRLEKTCSILATQPEGGKSRPDLGECVRTFPVGGYILIFRPIRDGIELLMVIHGARNYPPLVKKRLAGPHQ